MGFFSNLFNPAGAVAKAGKKAIAETRATKAENTALFAPYVQGGAQGFGRLQDIYGMNGPDAQANAVARFQESPGYQFRLNQGVDALDRSAAAKGMLRSGAQMKALTDFGQGMASNEWGKWVGGIGDIAKFGLTGATNNAATNTAANQAITKTIMDVGNAQASQGAAQMGMLGNLVGSALSIFSDRENKTDIQRIGKDENGVMQYAYRYKGDPKSYPKVVGPMAQDIEKSNPNAVKKVGGHRIVDLAGMR